MSHIPGLVHENYSPSQIAASQVGYPQSQVPRNRFLSMILWHVNEPWISAPTLISFGTRHDAFSATSRWLLPFRPQKLEFFFSNSSFIHTSIEVFVDKGFYLIFDNELCCCCCYLNHGVRAYSRQDQEGRVGLESRLLFLWVFSRWCLKLLFVSVWSIHLGPILIQLPQRAWLFCSLHQAIQLVVQLLSGEEAFGTHCTPFFQAFLACYTRIDFYHWFWKYFECFWCFNGVHFVVVGPCLSHQIVGDTPPLEVWLRMPFECIIWACWSPWPAWSASAVHSGARHLSSLRKKRIIHDCRRLVAVGRDCETRELRRLWVCHWP